MRSHPRLFWAAPESHVLFWACPVRLSLALAAALVVVAGTISSVLLDRTSGGWFVYASDVNALASSGDSNGDLIRGAIVWLVAITVWLGISWRLFQSSDN
jgi:hypothetical protein